MIKFDKRMIMEELLKNLMPIVYIAAGAMISSWSTSRLDRKKRRLALKIELIQNIHLLFGYNALYLRHNTISRMHDLYYQLKQHEFKQTQEEATKEEMNIYRNKMQNEIDASVKTYDIILKIEADIFKTNIEISELFNYSKSKQYKTLITEILRYTNSSEPHNIASDLTLQSFATLSKEVENRLNLRTQEFVIIGEKYISKIEAIK
jgi:hypothetical protein